MKTIRTLHLYYTHHVKDLGVFDGVTGDGPFSRTSVLQNTSGHKFESNWLPNVNASSDIPRCKQDRPRHLEYIPPYATQLSTTPPVPAPTLKLLKSENH